MTFYFDIFALFNINIKKNQNMQYKRRTKKNFLSAVSSYLHDLCTIFLKLYNYLMDQFINLSKLFSHIEARQFTYFLYYICFLIYVFFTFKFLQNILQFCYQFSEFFQIFHHFVHFFTSTTQCV